MKQLELFPRKWFSEIWGRLFQNPTKVQYAIALFVMILLVSFASTCRAADRSDVIFGAGQTYLHGQAPAIRMAVQGAPAWRESNDDYVIETALTLVGSVDYKGYRAENNIGASVLYMDGFGPVDVGIGLVYLQNRDFRNGSNMNFEMALGYRPTKNIGIQLRHWSNAGTRRPNRGTDMVFVTWMFR